MSVRQEKKITPRTIGYFLIALFGTLFLHVAPLFIFKPFHAEKKESQKDRRFTVMISKPESYDIEYWAQNSRPDLFAKPDRTLGYSAIAGSSPDPFLKRMKMHPENLSLTVISEEPGEKKKTTGLPPVFYVIPMSFQQTELKKEKKTDSPFYVYSGKNRIGLEPAGTPQSGEKPQGSVRIRITPDPNPDLPPAVSLEESCGIRQLDVLALRSVRKAAVSMSPVELKKFSTVFIDWKPVVQKEKKKNDTIGR